MRRLVATAVAVLASAAAALAVAPRDDAANAADPQTITLKVGDRVTVEGQPLGCRVARQGGHAIVDCRRGGPLAGTYGTVLSAHRALVVRYHSNTVAKVVFTAEHGGGARRCD
ncbi:MAG TPA: hypothetical protein VNT55_23940 [Baekduia sp.]|nr:hypothetical protein [Baekduia sp.]